MPSKYDRKTPPFEGSDIPTDPTVNPQLEPPTGTESDTVEIAVLSLDEVYELCQSLALQLDKAQAEIGEIRDCLRARRLWIDGQ